MFTIRCLAQGLTLALLITTMACAPSSGDVSMQDLIGLWNSSENYGAKTDVIYTRVSSDGGIIEYDYDGDEIDKGLTCYHVATGSVNHLTASRFMISIDEHDKQFEIEIELLDNGHALKIYFIDKNDASKTIKSQIWTREQDDSILDTEPSCH